MKKAIYLAIGFGKDRKTLRECIHQWLAFLIILKNHQPQFFSDWYGGGWSKKEALSKKIEFTYESIRKNLTDRRRKEDRDDELGFMFSMWDGKDDSDSMGISAQLGLYSELFNNYVSIEFPTEGEAYEYYKEKEHLLALLQIMIDYWKPDFIKINDPEKKIYPPFDHLDLYIE